MDSKIESNEFLLTKRKNQSIFSLVENVAREGRIKLMAFVWLCLLKIVFKILFVSCRFPQVLLIPPPLHNCEALDPNSRSQESGRSIKQTGDAGEREQVSHKDTQLCKSESLKFY